MQWRHSILRIAVECCRFATQNCTCGKALLKYRNTDLSHKILCRLEYRKHAWYHHVVRVNKAINIARFAWALRASSQRRQCGFVLIELCLRLQFCKGEMRPWRSIIRQALPNYGSHHHSRPSSACTEIYRRNQISSAATISIHRRKQETHRGMMGGFAGQESLSSLRLHICQVIRCVEEGFHTPARVS